MKTPYDIAEITPPPPVEIAGLDDPHIAWRLVSDMAHSIGIFFEDDDETRKEKIMAALQMASSLGPQDALEAQLIAQLVSCHNVASDALQRANQRGQKPEMRTLALKEAAQFMRLFRDQTRALMAYRGTPKQMAFDRRVERSYGRHPIPHEQLRRDRDAMRKKTQAARGEKAEGQVDKE
jgi:hypothetical protein